MLIAQPFDSKELKTTGDAVLLADEPTVILDPQLSYTAGPVTSVSPTGEVQAAWGSEGKGIGQLKYPEAVAVDSQGVLYVADRGNDRVQTFTLPAR